jgi:hypothetical protein
MAFRRYCIKTESPRFATSSDPSSLAILEVDGFRRLGTLNKPPTLLRTAVATLRSARGVGEEISGLVNRAFEDDEDADEEWTYPATAKDVLFSATFNHAEKSPTCVPCLKILLRSWNGRCARPRIPGFFMAILLQGIQS